MLVKVLINYWLEIRAIWQIRKWWNTQLLRYLFNFNQLQFFFETLNSKINLEKIFFSRNLPINWMFHSWRLLRRTLRMLNKPSWQWPNKLRTGIKKRKKIYFIRTFLFFWIQINLSYLFSLTGWVQQLSPLELRNKPLKLDRVHRYLNNKVEVAVRYIGV